MKHFNGKCFRKFMPTWLHTLSCNTCEESNGNNSAGGHARKACLRLSVSREELSLIARPKYLPPSAWTWLSHKLSEMSTLLSSSSLAICTECTRAGSTLYSCHVWMKGLTALTPRSAILLCERSREVMVALPCSPVARMRVVLSSSKLHGRASTVSVSVT